MYQHQMKSAMKQQARETKGRENMSDLNGSRVGMMEFRDPNAQMDSDLTEKEKDAASEMDAGKEHSAYPNGQTDAGHETSMEEAMQESKSTGDRMQMLPWKQWSRIWSLEIRMWSSVEWIRRIRV